MAVSLLSLFIVAIYLSPSLPFPVRSITFHRTISSTLFLTEFGRSVDSFACTFVLTFMLSMLLLVLNMKFGSMSLLTSYHFEAELIPEKLLFPTRSCLKSRHRIKYRFGSLVIAGGGHSKMIPISLRAFARCRDGLLLVITPAALSPLLISYGHHPQARCAFVALLMIVYWIFQPIPLPVTALLPIVLFPLLDLATTGEVWRWYRSWTR